MWICAVFLLLLGLNICIGDTPQTACGGRKPFKGRDSNCYDFKQICVKTEDPECDSFLKSCDQCVPDNTTIMKLVDYLNNRKIQSVSNMEELRTQNNMLIVQIKTLKKDWSLISGKLESIYTAIFVINFVGFICTIVILVLLNYCRSWCRRGRSRTIKGDKNAYALVNNATEYTTQAVVTPLNADKPNIKFKLVNHNRLVELFVQKTDLIIKIKRRICQECDFIRPDDYKIMKLRYNDQLLDDNQYLMSCVPRENVTVDCELDYTVDKRNVIVLKLIGSIPIQEMIQMNKNQTISDMKKILFKMGNIPIFATFISNMKLEDKWTLDECNLKDNDIVHVVNLEQMHLIITFVFGDMDSLVVQLRNTDLISDVKREISDKLKMIPDEFILLSTKEYLREEKYIFQCNIANGAEIRCCSWQRLSENVTSSFEKFESQLTHVYTPDGLVPNKKLIYKRYNFLSICDIKESKALVNEINKYQKMQKHSRFLKLNGFYHKDNLFFVSMDFVERQSLEQYAANNWPLDECEIVMWSKQILEALEFLHDNHLVYRYLKASNIWIDDNKEVKIAPIGFSKYLYGYDAHEMMTGLVSTTNREDPYMSPEVNNGREFEMASDVWAFGVILFRIVTNKLIYQGMDYSFIQRSIETYSNIECDSSNPKISSDLKYFIDQCLKGRPEERSTVRLLLLDPFIKNNCRI